MSFGRLIPVALAALLLLPSCSPGPGPVRSFILITIDTLRADHLGCYGYFRDTSPTLDSFAGESMLFENCYATMSITLPSHISILTSTYPVEHGVLANNAKDDMRYVLSPKILSYAGIASAEGIRTAAFVSAAPLTAGAGAARGFALYDEPERKERTAGETNERALTWLRENAGEPFFLWVHFFDPHAPYTPPAPFDSLFRPSPELERYMADRRIPVEAHGMKGGEIDVVNLINRYDGEIRYLDGELARLFETVRSLGLWETTVVAVVGDHGEGLYQHGIAGHGHTWAEQLRVPMMVRAPGQQAGRISDPVSTTDLLPTILGACPAMPRGGFLEQASGSNLLSEEGPPGTVLVQRGGRLLKYDLDPLYSLITGEWRLLADSRPMLFDLRNDPHELADRSDQNEEVLAAMNGRLEKILAEYRKNAEFFRRGLRDSLEHLPAGVADKLKALGYID